MDILILGGAGQVGKELQAFPWPEGVRIHAPDRRKIWLACDEHRESLETFLGARGFLKDTVAHAG